MLTILQHHSIRMNEVQENM